MARYVTISALRLQNRFNFEGIYVSEFLEVEQILSTVIPNDWENQKASGGTKLGSGFGGGEKKLVNNSHKSNPKVDGNT